MKVGFLVNQLDNRGTGNATFDYANFNEVLLKNESRIFTMRKGDHNKISTDKFLTRFGTVKFIDRESDIKDVDVLYHIKYGTDDGFRLDPSIRYCVHSVFAVAPHGDRYATVSKWLAADQVPYVPHIIDPSWSDKDFRKELDIPINAIVIGRHGGLDSFDIPWVWKSILHALDNNHNLHFVFMNTPEVISHRRVHYLRDGTKDDVRKFLNTCDTMLHARARGETFGIAIGEFAVLGKPVMTYPDVAERAHVEQLGASGVYYHSKEELDGLLKQVAKGKIQKKYAYLDFIPHRVMTKFNEVFLS